VTVIYLEVEGGEVFSADDTPRGNQDNADEEKKQEEKRSKRKKVSSY